MTDPLADLLISIKNAYMARKTHVVISHSKLKEAVSNVLAKKEFVKSVESFEEDGRKYLKIELLYTGKRAAITEITQISKPGLKRYTKSARIPRVMGGLGMAVISTPMGIMDSLEAKKKNLGGELICKVW